jgi:hypothetical protein
VTEGSTDVIAKPEAVSVYVRVAKGEWVPVVVPVAATAASVLSDTEMNLDLGSVVIPSGMTPYVQDA